MIEEIITSGRMNPEIDPSLHIWSWEIPLYLFIGGLVAGILIFSTLFYLLKKEDLYPFAVKYLPASTPVLLTVGLLALFLDLSHKLYFWRLYTIIRWESPMSWGAWTLLIIFPLSIIWSVICFREMNPRLFDKFPLLNSIMGKLTEYKRFLAIIILLLASILGMYTGILLSAFNARPFWNTAILGPLFLVSGLSTAAASVVLFARKNDEERMFSKIDIILIGVEIFFIIHLFMGFLAGTNVHIQAAELFLGGPYTAVFWVFIMGLGLVIPAFLEILELKNFRIPVVIPAILVLFGGLLLRFIIVDAGQASRWLY